MPILSLTICANSQVTARCRLPAGATWRMQEQLTQEQVRAGLQAAANKANSGNPAGALQVCGCGQCALLTGQTDKVFRLMLCRTSFTYLYTLGRDGRQANCLIGLPLASAFMYCLCDCDARLEAFHSLFTGPGTLL